MRRRRSDGARGAPGDDRDDEVPRRIVRLPRVQRDLDEELRFHFEETVEGLVSGGMSRDEAEREARERFGDEVRYRRQIASIDERADGRQRRRRRAGALRDTLRQAARSMRGSAGLSAGIVLAFALGIGANATMYGTIDRLLLQPPSQIAAADRVVRLFNDRYVEFLGSRSSQASFTYLDLMEQRDVGAFAGLAAYSSVRELVAGHGETARMYGGTLVTGNYWSVLGVRPALGRFFGPAEDVRGGPKQAVISFGVWEREFGSANVVGRMLEFGDGSYEIVGVAPKGFTGPLLAPVDVWMPLHVTAYELQGEGWDTSRQWWWLRAVARLAPGVSAQQAEAGATVAFNNSRREVEGERRNDARIIAASLIAASGPDPARETIVAKWLAAVSLLVLLIACANVANLLLARTIRQRRETGIRLALGISRSRLVGQMLSEGVLLAMVGGVAALLVTWWGGGFLQQTLLPDIHWGAPVTKRVLFFVGGVTLLAGLVSALVPAWQTTRHGISLTLRESSGGVTRSTSRVRAALSLMQASLSVVLLVGAGLFLRSLERVRSVDLGFDARHTVIADPVFDGLTARSASGPGAMSEPERAEFFRRAVERVEALPGVRAAASAQELFFQGSMSVRLAIEGFDSIPNPEGGPFVYPVSHGFFDAMGMPIRVGRGFEATDVKGAPQVAVINESMANGIWPQGGAIGTCMYIRDTEDSPAVCTRIVGIVADAHRGNIVEAAQFLYFVPIEQGITGTGPSTLIANVTGDVATVSAMLAREVLALDSRVRMVEPSLLQETIDPQLRSWRLGATMFTVFGLLSLIVAAIGLYSVLAFDVAQRTREIGLRSALGASHGSILGIFVGRALAITAIGTGIGLAVSLAIAPRIQDLLFQTSARDPATIGTVVIVLLTVAAVAALLPAARAARVDPNVALRSD